MPSRAGSAGDGRRGARLTSLDGLRGVAALVVVVHSTALALPSLAGQQLSPDRSSPAWWLTYTPLHLLWAGGEAVLVFFVLSGLVLALPHMRGSRPGTWAPYYRKRLVRLYVPVVVAVALTGLIVTLVPRVVDPAASWWTNAHAGPATLSVLVHDAGLLWGTGWLNSPLWSLRYEVFFSLFLPVFVVLVRQLTAPLWLSVPASLWMTAWAASAGHQLISFMFVFAVGVLLAQQLATLAAWGTRVNASRSAGLLWTALTAGGLLALLTEWWVKALVADGTLWVPLGRPGGVLGTAVLVFVVLHCPAVRRAFDRRPVQWLGTISFSLFLVHEPIVVSVATFTPATPSGLLVSLAVGLPLSLLAAVVFWWLVERPSLDLAGRVGRSGRGPAAPTVADQAVALVPDRVVPDGADLPTETLPAAVLPDAEPAGTGSVAGWSGIEEPDVEQLVTTAPAAQEPADEESAAQLAQEVLAEELLAEELPTAGRSAPDDGVTGSRSMPSTRGVRASDAGTLIAMARQLGDTVTMPPLVTSRPQRRSAPSPVPRRRAADRAEDAERAAGQQSTAAPALRPATAALALAAAPRSTGSTASSRSGRHADRTPVPATDVREGALR
ncbi:acyltransferase [Goekera deserti]|uniref:acyltransferase n=1 Tax=Goekera deserti TaxID=2497753 RepID=UPI0022A78DFD|nr:acyltransferase [Goekera deserti]